MTIGIFFCLEEMNPSVLDIVEKRTCETNPEVENSSFIFTVCVKSVPLNHFKLAYVVYIWLSKNFSKPTSKNREIGRG